LQQGREDVIFVVQNEDRSYRSPDQRILDDLAWADAWKRGQQALQEMLEKNEKIEATRKKDLKNYAQDVARERHSFVSREVNEVLGATNVPKEDLQREVDEFVADREME
jgi:N-methylhydantoinase B/oxoprolinase/acetone carboxylase alpha subunit